MLAAQLSSSQQTRKAQNLAGTRVVSLAKQHGARQELLLTPEGKVLQGQSRFPLPRAGKDVIRHSLKLSQWPKDLFFGNPECSGTKIINFVQYFPKESSLLPCAILTQGKGDGTGTKPGGTHLGKQQRAGGRAEAWQKNPHSDHRTAVKPLRQDENNSQQQRRGQEGKRGKSIPDLGSHRARGKVNVRLKRAKLSPKDTPTLVMCSQSITAGAELVTVPCACHSPSATAMARPQPSPTLPRAKLVLGETFTGFWQDLNLVLSENNHQHCCRDTQFAQQQLQPDKLLPVCPTQFPQSLCPW